ncbi:MAG: hypothetical protein AB7P20_23475 [Rhizobiaceae bacterium]
MDGRLSIIEPSSLRVQAVVAAPHVKTRATAKVDRAGARQKAQMFAGMKRLRLLEAKL